MDTHITEQSFMRYVPRRLVEHVVDAFRDSDGIWIWFDDYVVSSVSGHTLHAYTISELRSEITCFTVVD